MRKWVLDAVDNVKTVKTETVKIASRNLRPDKKLKTFKLKQFKPFKTAAN